MHMNKHEKICIRYNAFAVMITAAINPNCSISYSLYQTAPEREIDFCATFFQFPNFQNCVFTKPYQQHKNGGHPDEMLNSYKVSYAKYLENNWIIIIKKSI